MAIIMIRTSVIYLTLLLFMRLMGKRQLGELEISELVTAVLIADFASIPLQDIGIPMINGLLPLILLLCFEILVTGAVTKSVRFREVFCGKPSVLVYRGKIDQTQMRKNRFTLDELYEELRQQGVTDISKIEYAILETSGVLNVVLFPSEQPPTCEQMGIDVPSACFPTIIINEGRVLSANLALLGLDERWLKNQLRQRKIKSPKDVYLLSVDDLGNTYISMREVTP